MNIKQKLTWAFAAIACLPVILVAVLVVLNLRDAAKANFLDSSGREIRQIDNGMKQFFDGISQNVELFARDPRVIAAKGLKKTIPAPTPHKPPSLRSINSFWRSSKDSPRAIRPPPIFPWAWMTAATRAGRTIPKWPSTIRACVHGTRPPWPHRAQLCAQTPITGRRTMCR
nr:hypothetical protein GCM10020185_64520 [Pseudomonas brassicacearum subsp. brassicacearum]